MSAFCLYAFAPAACAAAVAALADSDAELAGLHSVQLGELAAVLMTVDEDSFSEAELADHGWVLREASRQCEVLAAMRLQGTLMPVRFGSLFASHQAVMDVLSRHRDLLAAALSDLAGKSEWSVRASCNPQCLSAWLTPDALATAAGPGRRYLEQQRAAKLAATRLREWLAAQCSALQAIADEHAVRYEPAPLAVAADQALTPFWQASLLVNYEQVPGFHAALERLQSDWPADGVQLVLAGPWPAYSFGPALPA